MRRVLAWSIPVLFLFLVAWGCADDPGSTGGRNSVITPESLHGAGGGGGGGCGDCMGCPADSCTCPNHMDCMMGGGDCDPNCPGGCHDGGGGCDTTGHGGHHGGGGCDSTGHHGHHGHTDHGRW
ncbi:MAG: hypothetical protein ACE15D_03405 [Candidatus Eisenbacteria bacterium]|nr:hypothetical protein [Candidatus Eisenbacteria bacterium]